MSTQKLIWSVEQGEVRLGEDIIRLPSDTDTLVVEKHRFPHVFSALWVQPEQRQVLEELIAAQIQTWLQTISPDHLRRINLLSTLLQYVTPILPYPEIGVTYSDDDLLDLLESEPA